MISWTHIYQVCKCWDIKASFVSSFDGLFIFKMGWKKSVYVCVRDIASTTCCSDTAVQTSPIETGNVDLELLVFVFVFFITRNKFKKTTRWSTCSRFEWSLRFNYKIQQFSISCLTNTRSSTRSLAWDKKEA